MSTPRVTENTVTRHHVSSAMARELHDTFADEYARPTRMAPYNRASERRTVRAAVATEVQS